MAKQFQFRRGTTAENNAFKGAPGEVTYDIERKELRVHDGVTLGGKPIETSANLVHTIGNETINGGKTFTSAIGRKSSRKYSETDTSVNGTSFADTIIATSDSDNKTLSVIYTQRIVDGLYTQTLYRTFNPITGKYIDIQGRINDDNAHSVHISGSAGTNECLSRVTNSTGENTIACQGWVNNPDKSTNVVHRTGNETIAGYKTLKNHLCIQDPSKDITTTPTANRYWGGVEFKDSKGVTTGYIRSNHYTSGRLITDIQTSRDINGTIKYANIGVAIDSDGTVVTECPTPPSTSNGTQIATTAWVNTAAVHKTGDETIDGVKTFKASPESGNGGYKTRASYSKGSSASSTQYFWTNTVYDKDGSAQANKLSQIFTQVDTNNALKLTMAAFRNVAGESVSTSLSVGFDASGNVITYAPTPANSSNSTNIATTAFVKSVLSSSGNGLATYSKGSNGYYKFNNGLIIQWGRTGEATGGARTITFPTAFSTTNYQVCPIPLVAGQTISFYAIALSDTEKTTTTAVIRGNADVSKTGWSWIAIGY